MKIGNVLKQFVLRLKENKGMINVFAFTLCLFCLGAMNLLTKDKAISEYENRTLEQKPVFQIQKLFRGAYFQEFEMYFADQFVMRDSFARTSTTVKEMKGLPGGNNIQIVASAGFNAFEEQAAMPYEESKKTQEKEERPITASTTPLSSNPNDEPAPPHDPMEDSTFAIEPTPQTEAIPTPTVAQERDDHGQTIGKTLIYQNSAMALFPFNRDSGSYYAHTLNRFLETAGEGVRAYSMLIPTSTEFIDNEKYRSLSDSQKETIVYVNERLRGVITVDAYTPLESHRKEYIYFRTDHHWTALGAYYAYTGFARAAGFETVSIGQYETVVIKDFLGSMYDLTGSSNLKRSPDTVTVYKPFVKHEYHAYYDNPVKLSVIDMSQSEQKNKYRMFISGDRPLGLIQTEVANGKRILVIKDSYGNAMVPFLMPHYEEIYVIDPRQYNKNVFELIKDKEIQEVLFLNYVPILSYNGFIDLIVKIMDIE